MGLTLGGTVSAGAYTAGVLDFLVEALDAWDEARGKPGVPSHRVIIDVASGASGGALCALLLAKALGSKYSAWKLDAPEANNQNPFYRCWVKLADGFKMLKTDDLAGSRTKLQSLLCADVLGEIVDEILRMPTPDKPIDRAFHSSPFPVFLTLTNLRGVPYAQMFNGGTEHREFFVQHADYVSLAIDVSGTGAAIPSTARVRPDAFKVSKRLDGNVWTEDWDLAAQYARGSSAFPFGLPLISLERPMEHYQWRWVRSEDEKGNSVVLDLHPQWEQMTPGGNYGGKTYRFQCADGGVMNNLPIELTRTWLAGLLGHNPREPDCAKRAIVAVDPFADSPNCHERPEMSGPELPLALLRSLVANNRFATADQSNFLDQPTHSRFLIAPVRQEAKRVLGEFEALRVSGGKAIASAGFDAFIGFFCEQFREHDFQLGRLNCQQFLSKWFVLGDKNDVFYANEVASGAVVAPNNNKPNMRRIVYLAPHLDPLQTHNPHLPGTAEHIEWPYPEWPRGKLEKTRLFEAFHVRSESVTAKLGQMFIPGFFGVRRWLYRRTVKPNIDESITNGAFNAIEDALREWDLLKRC